MAISVEVQPNKKQVFYEQFAVEIMKQKVNDYRDGLVGAILDEYELALQNIMEVLKAISQEEFESLIDEKR